MGRGDRQVPQHRGAAAGDAAVRRRPPRPRRARQGRGAQISIFVGVLAALLATFIGTVLGAFAGFFGGKVGDALEWLYNVFTAIPGILLIFAFAAVAGRGVQSVVLILA